MNLSRQDDILTKGRRQQKQRTREALLDAATELARHGQAPSIADVAEAARVSTATAYRYFPNPDSLWLDIAIRQRPRQSDLLENLPADAEARIDVVVRRIAQLQLSDEALWRAVQRATLDRWFGQVDVAEDERVPLRGTVRLDVGRAALAPLQDTLPPELLERLTMAMMMVFGTEAMVVTRDVCGLDQADATELMSWAARSLVRAALAEACDR